MDFNSYLEKKLTADSRFPLEKLKMLQRGISEENTLGDVLVEQKLMEEDDVLAHLSRFYGLPFVNLSYYQVEPAALELVPSSMARKLKVLPLFKVRNCLMLAMANPSDVHVMDEIRIKTTLGVEPVLALPSSIRNAITRVYNLGEVVTHVMDGISDEKIGLTERHKELELEKLDGSGVDDEPIVKLVNLFIMQAVRQKASDLHINPEEKSLRIRFRVDGVLHEVVSPPKKYEPAIISRVKVLANLDIAERRKPQDGRIKLKVDNKVIDFRVSTFPTIYGENVVMRILDSSSVLYGLDEIGFLPRDLEIFRRVIRKPYGIILVTGPTGSGKTTTLYSALETINSVDKNIITLEDPVEYQLQMIRQSQVNPKVGFTFDNGLRAILRQDPDIIMVGEIRDSETAKIAIEAALTGHLVFSTLHTNDSVSTIVRLSDMGIENFLLSSSIICIMAQRLLRKVCQKCVQEYVPAEESLREINYSFEPGTRFKNGSGCQTCLNTGYSGRIGIYEVLQVTPEIREAILKDLGTEQIKKIARKEGMRFLREDGIEKVKMGITTIEEVLRVTKEQ